MNIVIISNFPFPKGLAATNRIIAYSKGLIACGANVTIVMPYIFTDDMHIPCTEYCYESIKYVFTYPRKKATLKMIRALSVLSGYRKRLAHKAAYNYLQTKVSKKGIDYIFIANDSIPVMKVFSKLAEKLNSKAVFVTDEYPPPIRTKLKKTIPWWKRKAYKKVLCKFDAYVFILEALRDYYTDMCAKPAHIMHIITDTSRYSFQTDVVQQCDRKYCCYMGNMELFKDNVDLIIISFNAIAKEFPFLDLYLYGAPSKSNETFLSNLIKDLGLENRVFIKGSVEFDKVPGILMNAEILLASQPNTTRASGGFPTKLGEYLASGKPAIITKVGENDRYVQDRVHAYFVEPENEEDYANTIKHIMNNYDEALMVARNGKQLIEENYSHVSSGRELYNFLERIKYGESDV